MIDNLINEIEQAMLPILDNGQLSQLRKVLEYTFRNISVTEKESMNAESSNQVLVENFVAAKKVEGCSEKSISYYKSTISRQRCNPCQDQAVEQTFVVDCSRL